MHPSDQKKKTQHLHFLVARLIYGFISKLIREHLSNDFKLNEKVLMAFVTLTVKTCEKLEHVPKLKRCNHRICVNGHEIERERERAKESDESQKSYSNHHWHRPTIFNDQYFNVKTH